MKRLCIIILAIFLSGCFPDSNLRKLRILGDTVYQIHNLVPFHMHSGVIFIKNNDWGSSITLCEEDMGNISTFIAYDKLFFDVALSPDDKHLLICYCDAGDESNSSLAIFDLENRSLKQIDVGKGIHATPQFSPSAERVVFSYSADEQRTHLYMYFVQSGEYQVLTNGDLCERAPVFLDKNRLLFWRASKFTGHTASDTWHYWELCLRDEDGNEAVLTDQCFYNLPVMSIHPSKSYALITEPYNGTSFLLDIDARKISSLSELLNLNGHSSLFKEYLWAGVVLRDGHNFGVVISKDNRNAYRDRYIYLVDRREMIAKRVSHTAAPIEEICFSSNSKTVFYTTTIVSEYNWLCTMSLTDLEIKTINFDEKGTTTITDISHLFPRRSDKAISFRSSGR